MIGRAVPMGMLMAFAALAAACSVIPDTAEPVLPSVGWSLASGPADAAESGDGIVVLTAAIQGLECASGYVVLARGTEAGFVPVSRLELGQSWAGVEPVAAAPLPAGRYHVVQYACRNGTRVTYVGRPEGVGDTIPWQGSVWSSALASFSLVPGQVADLGSLTVLPAKPRRFATGEKVSIAVGPLSDKAAAGLAADEPDIAARRRPESLKLAVGGDAGLILVQCTLDTAQSGAGPDTPGTATGKKQKSRPRIAIGSRPVNSCREQGSKTESLGSDQAKAG